MGGVIERKEAYIPALTILAVPWCMLLSDSLGSLYEMQKRSRWVILVDGDGEKREAAITLILLD